MLTRYIKFHFFDKYAFVINLIFENQKLFYRFFNSFKVASTHILVFLKKNLSPISWRAGSSTNNRYLSTNEETTKFLCLFHEEISRSDFSLSTHNWNFRLQKCRFFFCSTVKIFEKLRLPCFFVDMKKGTFVMNSHVKTPLAHVCCFNVNMTHFNRNSSLWSDHTQESVFIF